MTPRSGLGDLWIFTACVVAGWAQKEHAEVASNRAGSVVPKTVDSTPSEYQKVTYDYGKTRVFKNPVHRVPARLLERASKRTANAALEQGKQGMGSALKSRAV